MAKAITKYQAEDGSEFVTEAEAQAHDRLCAETADIIKLLHPIPEDCDFSNGGGFVQQIPAVALAVQRGIVKVARRYFNRDEIYDRHFDYAENAEKPVGYTFVGRLINDGCPNVLYGAWHRIMCMDENFREWGQPYFASHPNEAKQIDRTPKPTPRQRDGQP
jgi:hypothetical protein